MCGTLLSTLLIVVLALDSSFGARSVAPSSAHSVLHHAHPGKRLRVQHAWEHPPYWYLDKTKTRFVGFVPDVLDKICEELGMDFEMTPAPYFMEYNGSQFEMGAYVPFVTGRADAVLLYSADIVQGYHQPKHFAAYGHAFMEVLEMLPSSPLLSVYTDHFTALLRKTERDADAWRLFSPFRWQVWLAICVLMTMYGLCISLLTVLANVVNGQPVLSCGKYSLVSGLFKHQYHVWAAILQGEDFEWLTWPGRIFRLGLMFFVLISVSTYTANLAAFFTAESEVIYGPQNMDELKSRIIHSDYPRHVFSEFAQGHLSAFNATHDAHPEALGEYDWSQIKPWLVNRLLQGKIDAVIGYEAQLRGWRQEDCDHLVIAENIVFGEEQFLLAFRREDHHLVNDMRYVLMWLKTKREYQELQRRDFALGVPCGSSGENEEDLIAQMQVGMDSQRGLFYIASACIGLALLAGLAQVGMTKMQGSPGKDDHGEEDMMDDNEMLRTALRSLRDIQEKLDANYIQVSPKEVQVSLGVVQACQ